VIRAGEWSDPRAATVLADLLRQRLDCNRTRASDAVAALATGERQPFGGATTPWRCR
jgi:hypothetical protein